MSAKLRGSQKHLLDLLDSSDYPASLNRLLFDARTEITSPNERKPVGTSNRKEWEVPKFCEEFGLDWVDQRQIENWWLPKHQGGKTGKGATWDLISTCKIAGRNGLLLVEAKAHEEELDYAGKSLSFAASTQSKRNHEHIARTLREASAKLNEKVAGVFNLAIDSHYQLANRIAWASKLSESGVLVVLLYLGFIGDTYFRTDYFRDADHWQRSVEAYMHGVLPLSLQNTLVEGHNGGGFTMLVKSLPILEISR